MDKLSKERRSWNMGRIKGFDTQPELFVRSFLHKNGFRFRLHVKVLPGKPDIVLAKYRTIIEIRGCYWHRHEGCKYAYTPKTNSSFWSAKFKENVERDKQNDELLRQGGWTVIIIWACEIRTCLEDRLSPLLKMRRYQ